MTDTLSLVLGIVGLILAIATTWKSLSFVKEREAAEKELVKILVRSYKRAHGDDFILSFPATSPDDLRKLEAALDRSLKELNENYRVSVVRAIQQPSESGRKAYRQKLLKEISQAAI